MKTELQELIDKMTDAQFNEWVMSWLSIDWVVDTISNWDDDTQQNAIEEIKEILK